MNNLEKKLKELGYENGLYPHDAFGRGFYASTTGEGPTLVYNNKTNAVTLTVFGNVQDKLNIHLFGMGSDKSYYMEKLDDGISMAKDYIRYLESVKRIYEELLKVEDPWEEEK